MVNAVPASISHFLLPETIIEQPTFIKAPADAAAHAGAQPEPNERSVSGTFAVADVHPDAIAVAAPHACAEVRGFSISRQYRNDIKTKLLFWTVRLMHAPCHGNLFMLLLLTSICLFLGNS